MKFDQTKREFKSGAIVMIVVFLWLLVVTFLIAALLNKAWIWHLSWNLVPVIAFVVGMLYDIKHTVVPMVKDQRSLNIFKDQRSLNMVEIPVKKIWDELSESHITVIREATSIVSKQHVGLY